MSEATEDDIIAAALAAAARVQVVSGTPDNDEVAALVAGLAAVSFAPHDVAEDQPQQQWVNRGRTLSSRGLGSAGTDQWRWSLHA